MNYATAKDVYMSWKWNFDEFIETVFLIHQIFQISFFFLLSALYTAQKMKFSIKDFFSKLTKSKGNSGFGHIYLIFLFFI